MVVVPFCGTHWSWLPSSQAAWVVVLHQDDDVLDILDGAGFVIRGKRESAADAGWKRCAAGACGKS